MREDGMVEILRRGFRNGEPAAPLRLAARSALDRRFPEAADADRLDDVLLVISELVQNVSQHTGGDGELVLSADDHVLVEVADGDPEQPHVLRPDAHRLGGRGLLVVSAVAVEWGTRPAERGKVVWARLEMGTRDATAGSGAAYRAPAPPSGASTR
jgi:hypothetical protein